MKLSPNQIKEIRDLHARGYRDTQIAEKTGIPQTSVRDYLREERVRRIEQKYMNMHRVTI